MIEGIKKEKVLLVLCSPFMLRVAIESGLSWLKWDLISCFSIMLDWRENYDIYLRSSWQAYTRRLDSLDEALWNLLLVLRIVWNYETEMSLVAAINSIHFAGFVRPVIE